ncbi:MAG: metallophosphoesterase family protein [Phycisphaerales bacterium]|nr:metallophosphoesterase family protein [Phycisphaerales bacterium]MCI0675045.1 metallophosphoesterase family protein [Phycisphaerales bacterium]
MPDSKTSNQKKRAGKYRRARIRHFLFTSGPNKLSGGRVRHRHLSQDIVVREVEVSSPHWPAKFHGLRIGHVSDFHLGELLPLNRALSVVKQLGAQRPDLIACTGDLVDLDHHDAGPVLFAMADLQAPMGALMVLGNHDELHCPQTIARLAEQAGVVVLRNEVVKVNRQGDHLRVGGIHWAKSAVGCAKHIDQTCGDYVDLLLAHNPKAFLRAADLEIPLTLAGHTHGGQISLKKRPTSNGTNGSGSKGLKVGLFESGPSRLYVTSGVGAWFPLRINCPAEIAMITMKHGA